MKYSDAGVDIDAADQAKSRIRALAHATFTPQVLSEIGSFGGLFRPDLAGMKEPVLVSSADGVGTKLKVAFLANRHDCCGADLVSHCVNDILVQGAVPLFFMDYLALGKVDPDVVEQIVAGVARGCSQAGCALLGGETAEMPDFYRPGEYDLAGFIVGLVERSKLVDGSAIRPGDRLLGLPSAGLHTNGYSLARKLFFDVLGYSITSQITKLGARVDELLLAPHLCYLPAIRRLLGNDQLHGMAHITGGGLTDNLPRILPDGCCAEILRSSWPVPALFDFMRSRGAIADAEMYRTFNMGIGMILVVDRQAKEAVVRTLQASGQISYLIGSIAEGTPQVRYL